MTATSRRPSRSSRAASEMPALPPPMTRTSWCSGAVRHSVLRSSGGTSDRERGAQAAAGLEPEADAADGDDALPGVGGLELAAQAADGDVEGLGRAVPVLVPHLVHQRLARHHLVVVGGEDREDVELLGGQRELALAEVDAARGGVDLEARGGGDGGVVGHDDRAAAQQRPHPGEQLGEAERLGEVVVRADVEADHAVELAGARGDHDDAARCSRRHASAGTRRCRPCRAGRGRGSRPPEPPPPRTPPLLRHPRRD